MPVRFLPDGTAEYLDGEGAPIKGAALPFSPEDIPQKPLPWQDKPFMESVEYAVNDTIRAMSVPREQIMAKRAPFPQQLLPQQFGYDRTALTISDVLMGENWTPQFRSWVSGRAVMTPRRQIEDDAWGGTPLMGGAPSPNRYG